ncbi:MAG: cation diffusion facilitator family transporter [Melioribacteraceae bacterium]|nr:cation diffusion facilitator family transporter [Melioribacteraceae bacterium]
MSNQLDNIVLNKRAAKVSLVAGIIIFITKFSAFLITDSTAIFSDATESIINIVAASVALYSIIISSKPADKDHPYGHGKIEYFSAGFEGLLIALAGLVIIYTGIEKIIVGSEPSKLGIGILLLGVSSLANLFLSLYIKGVGEMTKSLTLIADAKHILADVYTSFGIIVGLGVVMLTDIPIFDPIIAIIVAVNILFTGYNLVRESVGGLMNEVDSETMEIISNKIISIRKPEWIDIHELRFWKSANNTFVDFHLVLPYYFTIKEAHKSDDLVLSEMSKILPGSQVKIHMDYCDFTICKYCEFKNCEERKEELVEKLEWNQDRIIGIGIRKTNGLPEP